MTLPIIQKDNFSSSIVYQLPATVPLADTSSSFCSKISNFCSKMRTCILKVVAAVRDFFAWIFFSCTKQKQNLTISAPTASETSAVSTAPKPPETSDAPETLETSDASAEEILSDSESTEDLGDIPNALDLDSDEANVDNQEEVFSDPEIEKSADSDSVKEKSTSFFNKGVKFMSKNGNQILSKATGIKTEYATSAMGYLALSAEAARQGKYKIAAVAGASSISAAMLAGMNLFIPKEVRELNKLTTYVSPNTYDS